jgi:hypothetical protein
MQKKGSSENAVQENAAHLRQADQRHEPEGA